MLDFGTLIREHKATLLGVLCLGTVFGVGAHNLQSPQSVRPGRTSIDLLILAPNEEGFQNVGPQVRGSLRQLGYEGVGIVQKLSIELSTGRAVSFRTSQSLPQVKVRLIRHNPPTILLTVPEHRLSTTTTHDDGGTALFGLGKGKLFVAITPEVKQPPVELQ